MSMKLEDGLKFPDSHLNVLMMVRGSESVVKLHLAISGDTLAHGAGKSRPVLQLAAIPDNNQSILSSKNRRQLQLNGDIGCVGCVNGGEVAKSIGV